MERFISPLRQFFGLVIVFAAGTLFSYAQGDILFRQTVIPDSNSAAMLFERNINTYLWNASARYRLTTSEWFLRLKENFTSSFVRSQYSSFRDEQSLSFTALKKVSEPFSIAADVQSFVLSDNQTLGTSNAGIHAGAAGIAYRPVGGIVVTPMLGLRYDKQQLYRDEGMNYRLYAEGDSLEFGDSRYAYSGHINQSDLGRRAFKNNAASFQLATEFAPGSADSLHFGWSQNRNDFYIPADSNVFRTFGVTSNIRSRTEEAWNLQNILRYDAGGGFAARLTVNVDTRNIDNDFSYKPLTVLTSIPFNTTVQEFRIDGNANIEYQSVSTVASLGMQLGERTERHRLERINGIDNFFQENRARQESRLDNIAFRNSLNGRIFSQISASDGIDFSASISVLQYDTPDTNNTDDRDELQMNLSLNETHWFSNAFVASLTAEATMAHLVYLLRDKSSNNNWNRIYRLQPSLTYRPSENFRMYNAFEVLANYTVFDFELIVPSIKSYSYRQVAFLDSTSYDMTRTIGMDMVAYVRIFERGELRWQEFAERPLQRFEEVTFSPQIRYNSPQWFFAFGFRSFAQKRFTYSNNIRRFESTFLSAGPTTNIVIRLSPISLVEIRGWKEYQRHSGGRIQEYSNMTMNVRYYF